MAGFITGHLLKLHFRWVSAFADALISVTVLYPKTPDNQFDTSYYLDHHTPLVREWLTPVGLAGIDPNAGYS